MKNKILLIFFVFIFLPEKTWAGINLKGQAALWAAVTYRSLTPLSYNPENTVLRIPQGAGTLELRPELTLSQENFRIIGRPHFIGREDYLNRQFKEHEFKIRWSEGYLRWDPWDYFSLAYGLQNFQWGPAEAGSPGNRIFLDTLREKDVLYAVKGHHILRMNFTLSQTWSEILMAEFSDNPDNSLAPGDTFNRKILLKSELGWSGGAQYAGLVLGGKERQGLWLGEYLNLELLPGLFFYFDAAQEKGSRAWYPTRNTATRVILMEQTQKESSRIYTFSVTGLRYAFENGDDLRGEWIFEEAGYSAEAFNLIRESLISSDPLSLQVRALNYARFEKNGLEFSGRNYLMLSWRIPDIFQVNDWWFYSRYLFSIRDYSSGLYLSTEKAVGERGVVFADTGATQGGWDSELRGPVSFSFTLGGRYSW